MASENHATEIHIRPDLDIGIDWKELRAHKELIYFFVWRDLKVRYKQTVVGVSWAIVQPLITMLVFTVLFTRVADVDVGSTPYPLFSLTGLLFWTYFARSLELSSGSLVANQSIITKVYFPRAILPISGALVGLVDLAVASVLLAALFVYYGVMPDLLGIALVIPMIAMSFIAASGVGLMLSPINAQYRDVKHALPFVIQTMLFLTPVAYPISAVPDRLQGIIYLNPMTGIISIMRYGLFHDEPLALIPVLLSLSLAPIVFICGSVFFRWREGQLADVL